MPRKGGERGGGVFKNIFFGPLGLRLVLKLGGGGAGSPGSATGVVFLKTVGTSGKTLPTHLLT